MKIFKNTSAALTIAALSILTTAVFVNAAHATDQSKADPAKAGAVADAEMTNAEVRKVDKDSKKITLKHDAIKSLDMPGMTMVFQVKDAGLLEKAQAGDKVQVKIIKDGNAYVVTDIQPRK
jgi:Cu(I)/Ag(I) efflux system periplasmic protein CusF